MARDRQEITELISLQLGIAEISIEQRFIEDLGAESADLVNLIAAVEDRFDVVIDETELPEIRTVADLHRIVIERS